MVKKSYTDEVLSADNILFVPALGMAQFPTIWSPLALDEKIKRSYYKLFKTDSKTFFIGI